MLELFKRWFKPEAVTVAAKDLDAWISSKESSSTHDFEAVLSDRLPALQESTSEARDAVEQLRTAELRNPDIPERHKHFMIGNREEYAKQATRLLDAVKLPVNDWLVFFSDFDAGIKHFAQQSTKPFHILQEFFSEETKQVASCIAMMEKAANKVKEAHARIEAVRKLRNAHSSVLHAQAMCAELETAIAASNQQMQTLEQERASIIAAITALEHSTEWSHVDELHRQIMDVQSKRAAKKQEVLDRFGRIVAALRRYAHMSATHRKLAESYASEPVEALCSDHKMQIVNILDDLGRTINSGAIQLADDKKERALQAIASLDRKHMETFVREYGVLSADERRMTGAVKNLPVVVKRDVLRRQVDSYPGRIAAASHEREKLQKSLAKARTETGFKSLEPLVCAVEGTQVTII